MPALHIEKQQELYRGIFDAFLESVDTGLKNDRRNIMMIKPLLQLLCRQIECDWLAVMEETESGVKPWIKVYPGDHFLEETEPSGITPVPDANKSYPLLQNIYLVVGYSGGWEHESELVLDIVVPLMRIHLEWIIQHDVIAKLTLLLNDEIDLHHHCKDMLNKERSEKIGFQHELEEHNRKVTEAIVETQEFERGRIARELHDSLGNALSITKLLLCSIQEETTPPLPGSAAGSLNRAINLLDGAIAESRQISRNLSSEMLMEHGLIPTIQEMIERINGSGMMKASFQVFGLSRSLPKHIEQNLFRIIQELLNNVIKHSRASEVTVQCIEHDNALIVMVEDDGVGIKSSPVHMPAHGMGLANVQTRLSVMSGSMAIDSTPGRGTVITLDIPLQSSD